MGDFCIGMDLTGKNGFCAFDTEENEGLLFICSGDWQVQDTRSGPLAYIYESSAQGLDIRFGINHDDMFDCLNALPSAGTGHAVFSRTGNTLSVVTSVKTYTMQSTRESCTRQIQEELSAEAIEKIKNAPLWFRGRPWEQDVESGSVDTYNFVEITVYNVEYNKVTEFIFYTYDESKAQADCKSRSKCVGC